MSKGARYSQDNLGNLGPAAQAQIRAQLQGKFVEVVPESTPIPRALQPMKPALRQNTKGPNKTELAFASYLQVRFPGHVIDHEPIKIKLANGVLYIPDFFICDGTQPTAFEVKGFMRDDAAAKIKIAASKFRWIKFVLVFKLTKKQGGGWELQHVLP